MEHSDLNKQLGNIDLYLLDQVLKGRYDRSMKILDAGCGEGRNMVYFLRKGYEVYGVDNNPAAIQMLQFVSGSLSKGYDTSRFIVSTIETIPFEQKFFDAIICSAVLHFAKNEKHFDQMFSKLFNVLKSGGSLFIRMTSDIGLEDKVVRLGENQYQLPDGSIRYLLKRDKINKLISQYNLSLLEPVKTVNVDDKRCMTNLMMKKQ